MHVSYILIGLLYTGLPPCSEKINEYIWFSKLGDICSIVALLMACHKQPFVHERPSIQFPARCQCGRFTASHLLPSARTTQQPAFQILSPFLDSQDAPPDPSCSVLTGNNLTVMLRYLLWSQNQVQDISSCIFICCHIYL